MLAENKEDVAKFADYVPESAPAPAKKAAAKPAAEAPKAEAAAAPAASGSAATDGDRIFASPIAKKMALERGLDLSQIKGTGPNQRITKADVEAFKPASATAAAKAAAPAKPAVAMPAPAAGVEFTDIPLTNMRKVIAERLQASKSTIPHYYLTVEINLDKILKLRQALNAQANEQYKLSVNDFVIKASAAALKQVPEVNSAWMETAIRRFTHADISVAVATPAGLITPIVRKADTLGLSSISNSVKDLALRARENKLAPHEYQVRFDVNVYYE